MDDFVYQQAGENDIDAIYQLVSKVFDEFVAPNYFTEGNQEFYKYLDTDAIRDRLYNNHFIILCKDNEQVAGIIEMRNFDHVSMLFVDKAYQGRGIAKQLLKKALDIACEQNPQLEEVSVNASPNAVSIYEKLGFSKTTEEQEVHGIRFTPMTLRV